MIQPRGCRVCGTVLDRDAVDYCGDCVADLVKDNWAGLKVNADAWDVLMPFHREPMWAAVTYYQTWGRRYLRDHLQHAHSGQRAA